MICLFYFQILFLNKLDLFQDKILHSERHLKRFFADFPGNFKIMFISITEHVLV